MKTSAASLTFSLLVLAAGITHAQPAAAPKIFVGRPGAAVAPFVPPATPGRVAALPAAQRAAVLAAVPKGPAQGTTFWVAPEKPRADVPNNPLGPTTWMNEPSFVMPGLAAFHSGPSSHFEIGYISPGSYSVDCVMGAPETQPQVFTVEFRDGATSHVDTVTAVAGHLLIGLAVKSSDARLKFTRPTSNTGWSWQRCTFEADVLVK